MENTIDVTTINEACTIASLFKQWASDVKPHVYEMFGENDDAFVESWMEYLDLPLARDRITVLQWSFAENYTQAAEYTDSWAEEFSRMLTMLGVELVSAEVKCVDVMGLASYEYRIKRGAVELVGNCDKYTHKGELTREDILDDLLIDYSEYQDCGDDYDYYCQKYALDDLEQESRDLFERSKRNQKALPSFFMSGHTLQLSDVMHGLQVMAWKL